MCKRAKGGGWGGGRANRGLIVGLIISGYDLMID